MAKRVTGPEIEKLIQLLAKVPGLGPRSARRAALHLVKKKDQLLGPLADAMGDAYAKVRICSCCGNVDTSDPCITACHRSASCRAESAGSTRHDAGPWGSRGGEAAGGGALDDGDHQGGGVLLEGEPRAAGLVDPGLALAAAGPVRL